MSEALLAVFISSVVGLISSLIVVAVGWKKAPAETSQIYQEIATKAGLELQEVMREVADLRAHLNKLECQMAERDRLIERWAAGIGRLIKQLESHEMTPVWRPEAMKDDCK